MDVHCVHPLSFASTDVVKGDFQTPPLLEAMYGIVKGSRKGGRVMTKAQEILKADIEKIDDEMVIEKVKIFIMGILAQQGISQPRKPPLVR